MFRASSDTAECIRNSPYESGNLKSPFKTRYGLSLYEYYNNHQTKAARFAQGMVGVTKCKSAVVSDTMLNILRAVTHHTKWIVKSPNSEMNFLGHHLVKAQSLM